MPAGIGALLKALMGGGELGSMALRVRRIPVIAERLKKLGKGAEVVKADLVFGETVQTGVRRVATQRSKTPVTKRKVKKTLTETQESVKARQSAAQTGAEEEVFDANIVAILSGGKIKAPQVPKMKPQQATMTSTVVKKGERVPAKTKTVPITERRTGMEVQVKAAGKNAEPETIYIPMKELIEAQPGLKRHITRLGKGGVAGKSELEELIASTTELETGLSMGEKMGQQFKAHPMGTAVGGLLLGDIAAHTVGFPIAGAIKRKATGEPLPTWMGGDPTTSHSYLVRQQMQLQDQERQRKQEIVQLQQLMAQNMTRLAAANPQLYNQILAGRQIPEGGVVIGGQPRQDLMEMLAYDMATGEYAGAQNPLAALAQ